MRLLEALAEHLVGLAGDDECRRIDAQHDATQLNRLKPVDHAQKHPFVRTAVSRSREEALRKGRAAVDEKIYSIEKNVDKT